MIGLKNKIKISLFAVIISLFFGSSVSAGILYVDNDGSTPWQTIAKALGSAKSGDTVSINDGTYTEGQLVVPPGVNLTSTSKDNSKVILRPKSTMGAQTPFLKLASTSPGSSGNQTISYLQLNGTNGANKAYQAILVRNRNDVRIHHCYIHDFPVDPAWFYTIQVESTQVGRRINWKDVWPADSQKPGNDSNINALWPANPMENFEFDNNVVKNCAALGPYHLKDAKIHDNVIDNRATWGWCIKGTPGLMWNVDIYNNTLLGNKTIYANQSNKTAWKVELWLHRSGCEYYNNTMNGYFSITIGKETKIYGNTITMSPADYGYQTAIEFNGNSYGEIYRNSISGAGVGIRVGVDGNSLGKNWIVEDIRIRENVFYNCKNGGIRIQGDGPVSGSYVFTTRNIYVSDNIVDGNSNSTYNLMVKQHSYGTGKAILSDVFITDNISMRNNGYAGSTKGTVQNLVIDNNQFFNNTYNHWNGSLTTRNDYSDPKLPDDPTSTISPVSPLPLPPDHNDNNLRPPSLSIVNG